MLENATIENFQPHLGETFQVRLPDGQTLAIVLSDVSATVNDNDPRRTRVPFSLIFRPPAGLMLHQGMYRMEGGPGAIDIFLVPIVPDREGPRIQAVFA